VLFKCISSGDGNGYRFIETEEDCCEAVRKLSAATIMALDLEGIKLSRTGSICLLQVYDGQTVYLFDVWTLKFLTFSSGLATILENNKVAKLMFDCRQDSDSLYHQFGVKLEGVIDLQVLEVVYRYHRVGQPPRFVYGLGRAIEEVNIVMPLRYKEQRESAKQLFSSESTWKERPLHGDIVTYCKEDIKAIYRLYDVFKGYFS